MNYLKKEFVKYSIIIDEGLANKQNNFFLFSSFYYECSLGAILSCVCR